MSTYYGPGRATWAGSYRNEIPSRERGPYVRPEPYLGRLLIDLPGFALEWTLRQDMRDMRRFRGIDLDGTVHAHHAPRELLRHVSGLVPVYSGRGSYQ